jgi:hypothetical protein
VMRRWGTVAGAWAASAVTSAAKMAIVAGSRMMVDILAEGFGDLEELGS